MVSRTALKQIRPRPREVDLIEDACRRYWNAFREGYCAAGGRPEDYPTWDMATDPVKQETYRCMRHAAEAFRGTLVTDGAMDDWFPDAPQRRTIPQIANDEQFVTSQTLARLGE